MDQINIRDLRNSIKGKGQKRQVVLSGRKGKTYADFIEPSTGLNAVLKASETEPVITSVANGYDSSGEVNYVDKITSDIVFSNLKPNATNYLGLERENSGVMSPVHTTTAPIYDSVFGDDRENKVCATFDGEIGQTIFNDYYGNVIRCFNGAQISNGHPSGTGNSLRINGGNQYAEVDLSANRVHLNSLDEWTIEFYWKVDNINVRNRLLNGANHWIFEVWKLENSNALRLYIGSNGVNWNIFDAVTITPPISMLSNTWYKFTLVYHNRNYYVFLDNKLCFYSGIKPVEDKIINLTKLYFGCFYNRTDQMVGNISNFAIWPYAKYFPQGGNPYGNQIGVSTIYPAISPNNLVPDTPKQDRYFSIPARFHVDLEGAVEGQLGFKETYGNLVRMLGNGTRHSRVVNVAGPSGFGNVNCIKTENFADTDLQINNIQLPDKFTIETWVYPINKSGAFFDIINMGGAFSIALNGSNQITLHAFSTGNPSNPDIAPGISTTSSYPLNNWYHIAFSYDGFYYRVFVNGNPVITIQSLLPVYRAAHFITFGGGAFGEAYFFAPTLTPYCKYTSNFAVPTSLDSFKENVYYYDISKAKMFKGYNGNWTEQPAIFVGEATTNANNVTGTITYSLNGRCHIKGLGERGEGMPATNVPSPAKMIIPHFLGTNKVNIDHYVYPVGVYGNYWPIRRDEKFKALTYYNNSGEQYYSYPVSQYGINYISLNEGNYGFIFNIGLTTHDPSGWNYVGFTHQQHVFDWEFIIERSF
jgi:hypothetical protein